MSAPTDVITVASTPTPADTSAGTQVPPDGFAEYQAFRRAQDRGEQAPVIETPKLPETPAETPKGEPVKTDEPEVKTAEESGTKEEEEQVREETEETTTEPADKSGKVQPDKVQKRIDRLTREKYELKGRIAALEDQLKSGKPAEKPAEAETKPAAPAQQSADREPAIDDPEFQDKTDPYGEWMKSWNRWDRRQEAAKTAEQTAKTEAKTAYETKKQAWDGKVAELKAKPEFEDYDDRMADTRNIRLSAELDYAIFEAGPEVAYHLASNLPELERIAKLAPMSAAIELGAIKASLNKTAPDTTTKTEAAAQPPKPKVTSAPKPIVPVGGGTGVSTPSVEDATLATDFTAWKKVRRAQDRDR